MARIERRVRRHGAISRYLAAAFAAFLLAGCGAASHGSTAASSPRVPEIESKDPSAEVVRVAGAGGVGREELAHWIAVQAATDYNVRPTRPVPAGVIPDPPLYRRCIAQLKIEPISPIPGGLRKPPLNQPTAHLRKECEVKYQALLQHVALILTSFQWLAGESAQQGIKVSEGRVRAELERFRKGQFSTLAGFQAYMRNTGQTYQDEMLRMRMDIYSNELARLAGEKAHTSSRRGGFEAFLRATPALSRRWAAKTTCAPGYVTQNCSNYKGTLEPELHI